MRPTNKKRYIQLDENGWDIEDENGNSLPIEYDYLRLYVGYRPDRDTALVEVKSSHCEMITHTWTKEDGTPMLWKADADGNVQFFEVDENDNYKYDKNGELIPTDDEEAGLPKRDEESGNGVPWEIIDKYDYNGIEFTRQQVVYELGEIVEVKRHKK